MSSYQENYMKVHNQYGSYMDLLLHNLKGLSNINRPTITETIL